MITLTTLDLFFLMLGAFASGAAYTLQRVGTSPIARAWKVRY